MAVRWLLSHPWSIPQAAPAEDLGCSIPLGRGSHRVSEIPGAKRGFKTEENKSERQKYKGKSPTQVPQVQKALQEPGTTVHDPVSRSHNQGSSVIHCSHPHNQKSFLIHCLPHSYNHKSSSIHCSHSHNQESSLIHPACKSHSFSFIPFTTLQPSLCLPPLEVPGCGSNSSVSLQHLIFPGF